MPKNIKRTPFGKLQIPLNLIPPLASDISPGMRKNEIGTVKQKIKKKKQSSKGCLPPRRKIKILTLEKIRKLKIKGSSEKKKKEAPAQPCRRVNIEDEEKLTKGSKLLPKKLLFQFDKRKMNQQAENLYQNCSEVLTNDSPRRNKTQCGTYAPYVLRPS